jgi:hypothetical protein
MEYKTGEKILQGDYDKPEDNAVVMPTNIEKEWRSLTQVVFARNDNKSKAKLIQQLVRGIVKEELQASQESLLNEGKRGESYRKGYQTGWDEAKDSLMEEFYNRIFQIMGELNDVTEKIGLAVWVDTDDSRRIQTIFAELQPAAANKLLKGTKTKVLTLLDSYKKEI